MDGTVSCEREPERHSLSLDESRRERAPAARHEAYCLPPWRRLPAGPYRVGIIADGNTRHGGHRGGKSATIALAEHCAARGDVGLLAVCVLSRENIEKRPDAFFACLEQLFLELGVEIAARQVLVRAGVRCGVYGDLGLLRARGGAAARLAAVLEAIAARTAAGAGTRTNLLFAVGYPSTMPAELALDVVVRTGVEEDGAIRLSGLDAHPAAVCLATTSLYPDFGPARFDDALAAAQRAFPPALAPGYDAAFVAEVIARIEAAEFARPVQLTLPVAAPPEEIGRLLDRLQAEGLGDRAAVGVEHVVSPAEEARRYGPPWAAGREIRLVAPGACRAEDRAARPAAFIAAGQHGPAFVLPAAPSIQHANVFAAPASPEGLVQALYASLRFAETHPALLGAERTTPAPSPSDPAVFTLPTDAVEELLRPAAPAHAAHAVHAALAALGPAGDLRAEAAAAGVTAMLQWAGAAGIRPSRRELLPAFVNYQMTAVIMCHRVAREGDPRGERWMEAGLHAAALMSSVALSDEEVFDRPTPDLSDAARRQWLDAVARYLGAVVHGQPGEAPRGPARAEIAAIAALWRATQDRFGEHAHPAVLAGWRRAIASLYTANVAEIDPDVARDPRIFHLRMVGPPRREAAAAIAAHCAAVAPAPVAARIRALLAALVAEPERLDAVVDELTVWTFLGHTAPSIAAGVLFRHFALLWPGALVTDHMADTLDRVATLIDYRFRLANDLSDLRSPSGLDRDGKPNAWTVLVPEGAACADAARATISALALCREVEAWIQRELARELADLERVWPELAVFVRRGVRVGALVYQRGHFATTSWSLMLDVFREIEAA